MVEKLKTINEKQKQESVYKMLKAYLVISRINFIIEKNDIVFPIQLFLGVLKK